MTPEEIMNDYYRDSPDNPEAAYDNIIEAIKRYAREMCDEQVQICVDEYVQARDRSFNQIKNAIGDSPNPQELQP